MKKLSYGLAIEYAFDEGPFPRSEHAPMTDAFFYHLQRVPLERVLPDLLERSIGRGWRCAVQASEERLRVLDDWLWTFAEESFLPHGVEADDGARQPIVLLTHSGNPYGAAVRFLV